VAKGGPVNIGTTALYITTLDLRKALIKPLLNNWNFQRRYSIRRDLFRLAEKCQEVWMAYIVFRYLCLQQSNH